MYSDCPGTHYRLGLPLPLGLKVCATHAQLRVCFKMSLLLLPECWEYGSACTDPLLILAHYLFSFLELFSFFPFLPTHPQFLTPIPSHLPTPSPPPFPGASRIKWIFSHWGQTHLGSWSSLCVLLYLWGWMNTLLNFPKEISECWCGPCLVDLHFHP